MSEIILLLRIMNFVLNTFIFRIFKLFVIRWCDAKYVQSRYYWLLVNIIIGNLNKEFRINLIDTNISMLRPRVLCHLSNSFEFVSNRLDCMTNKQHEIYLHFTILLFLFTLVGIFICLLADDNPTDSTESGFFSLRNFLFFIVWSTLTLSTKFIYLCYT